MKKFVTISVVLVVLTVIVSFSFSMFGVQKVESGEPTLKIRGSHALYWTLKPHIKEIESAIGATVDFSVAGGCGDGRKAVLNGDIGAICCPFTDEDLKGALNGAVMNTLALEPLMIIVNKENPVSELTVEQVRDLLSGKITNWKDLGGNDQKVAVVMRLHCGQHPDHWKLILPKEGWSKKRVAVTTTVKMIETVADIRGAIGHLGTVLYNPAKMKALRIDGVSPLEPDAFADKYPFYRPLSLLTSGEPDELERKLIDYLRNEKKAKPIFDATHLTISREIHP